MPKSEGDGRVIVAHLHPGQVSADFMSSLVNLIAYDTHLDGGRILHGGGYMSQGSGPNLSSPRNKVVESFLRTQAEWLWMVDSDMTFDQDTLQRLVEAADPKERPIVGGLCFGMRVTEAGDAEYFPTLYYLHSDGTSARLKTFPEDQLFRVHATGAACLLIHRTVFEKMLDHPDICPPPYRWFQEIVVNGKAYSEDITFCLRAGLLDIPVHVHTGIQLGHMKTRKITAQTYQEWWENEVVEPSFVVTGTGRSGTGYISQAFNALGVRCGHEEWWNPFNRRAPRLVGEASWLAVPFLEDYGGKVGLQIRDPLKVVNSLMNGDIFGDGADMTNPYYLFKKHHAELEGSDLADAVKFVVDWTERAEKHAQKVWRLEDLNGELFAEICRELVGVEIDAETAQQVLDSVPKTANKHKEPAEPLTWDDLIDFPELRDLAEKYGYL